MNTILEVFSPVNLSLNDIFIYNNNMLRIFPYCIINNCVANQTCVSLLSVLS